VTPRHRVNSSCQASVEKNSNGPIFRLNAN
jgi:hypothetical protein